MKKFLVIIFFLISTNAFTSEVKMNFTKDAFENAQKNGNKCPTRGKALEKPAYLVKWSRFGNVSKFKWSGSDWNRQ